MRDLHNIEKSAFKRGSYVGYGAGKVWHIARTNSTYGNWIALPINWIPSDDMAAPSHLYAFRLSDMSSKLNDITPSANKFHKARNV